MCFVFLLIIISIFPQFNGEINILEIDNNIVTQGERISSSETNSFPLINSNNYWSINLTNPGIEFEFETESTFNYLINSIQIQIFNQFSVTCINENNINRMEYILYYQIGTEKRVVNLQNANWTISGDTATVNIQPIPADRIIILRSVSTLGTHCMRYGLIGERIARVSVLFYEISLPNLVISTDTVLTDQGYTGVCSSAMCFGGKGKLMDGETDITNFEETGVGWSCPPDKDPGCDFDLNIQLTNATEIEEIVLLGLSDRQMVTPQVDVPEYGIEPKDIRVRDRLFEITIRIRLEVPSIRLRLSIGSGKSLVLTEIAVYSDDDVNLSVQTVSYNYVSIISQEIPTSSNIANFQSVNTATTDQVENGDMFVANTKLPDNPKTTTVSMNMTSQTTATFTPQNTTIQPNPNSPNPEIGIDCKKQSVFLSIIGVLAIFMITLLFNSVIVILLLAKNNMKIRKKLSVLEHTKTDASTMATYIKSYRKRHAHTDLDLTVVQNRIAVDDMYDRQEPIPQPKQEPTQEPTQTANIIHNLDSGFASPSPTVPNIRCDVMGDFNSLSIPMRANTSYAQIENLNSSAQRETSYGSCVQDEFEVPMEENSAYSSIPRSGLPQISVENCDTSINADTLDIPMVDNIGYVTARNELVVNRVLVENGMFNGKIENSDIKHIYASIANECSIEFPNRKSGEFPSYNVLVHK